MQNKPHVLVVDDDAEIGQLVFEYLMLHGFIVSVVANGLEALDALDYFYYDIIILDLMMPIMDGLQTITEVRKKYKTPIIMLTARGDPQSRVHGLESGADDYIAKPFEPRELLLRIYKTLDMTGNNNIVIKHNLVINMTEQSVQKNGQYIPLTRAEQRILIRLLENHGKVVSRTEIAQLCSIEERSVDVQIMRLRNKLEGENNSGHHVIKTVRGVGYMI